ncbi:MAG TPA: NAD-dependent epimerase/dehydratase family protein [Bacteroides sp.]|nr:NAD-dependent epimerase/dehydratase family protein [Bacteroides sp.]
MKIFVSGATGFIGMQLVRRLAAEGSVVHALYRTESKADPIRNLPGVVLFRGDILDKESLRNAMEGCGAAFHAAAFAKAWTRDPDRIFRLNVDGALNVVEAAGECGVKRVVVTSTAGVLGPSAEAPVEESSPVPGSFFTRYEASKFRMEQELLSLPLALPEIVIVNPTRVFGPGLLNESNSMTKMIARYMQGWWRLLPGDGNSMGNYVFVEDVVSGHILAMEKGKPGERYVLGGENVTYRQLFQYIREVTGVDKKLLKVPYPLMLAVAVLMHWFARVTGIPPLIVPGLIRKYNHNWIVSSEKAVRELGYRPMDLRTGIKHTVDWLKSPD